MNVEKNGQPLAAPRCVPREESASQAISNHPAAFPLRPRRFERKHVSISVCSTPVRVARSGAARS